MESTMQQYQLGVATLLRAGQRVHASSEVVTFDGNDCRRAKFTDVAENATRLACALRRLGVSAGDRVGTLCWNTQEHLEAYLAVPAMGAVLHTLNPRLFPDQLAWIVNHGGDRVLLVEACLVPVLKDIVRQLHTVEHIVVIGACEADIAEALDYAELLGAEEPSFIWPEFEENSAAVMCYTSGTTGDPKGVVYSHRSTYLHSMAACMADSLGISQSDRVLPIVPMFHANAWGMPYAAWMTGADLVFAGRFLQPEALCALIAEERVTLSGAVPTIWNDILHYAQSSPVDLSSLRMVVCGGSAVPRSLIERFEERHGVRIVQAWGMTETSPLAAVSLPPKGARTEDEMSWRAKTGRVLAGVELRIVDDAGADLPWDGTAVGEMQVRGPWVTARYYRDDDPAKFDRGWLRTGDVGSVDECGYIQITDRAKDVIKSGGEWISSVELENEIMGYPGVVEAAVVAVPDERWQERPLACVVLRSDAGGVTDICTYLAERVPRWWLPERWTVVEEIPKTSVGKFDKKVLRSRYAEGLLEVDLSGLQE